MVLYLIYRFTPNDKAKGPYLNPMETKKNENKLISLQTSISQVKEKGSVHIQTPVDFLQNHIIRILGLHRKKTI